MPTEINPVYGFLKCADWLPDISPIVFSSSRSNSKCLSSTGRSPRLAGRFVLPSALKQTFLIVSRISGLSHAYDNACCWQLPATISIWLVKFDAKQWRPHEARPVAREIFWILPPMARKSSQIKVLRLHHQWFKKMGNPLKSAFYFWERLQRIENTGSKAAAAKFSDSTETLLLCCMSSAPSGKTISAQWPQWLNQKRPL